MLFLTIPTECVRDFKSSVMVIWNCCSSSEPAFSYFEFFCYGLHSIFLGTDLLTLSLVTGCWSFLGGPLTYKMPENFLAKYLWKEYSTCFGDWHLARLPVRCCQHILVAWSLQWHMRWNSWTSVWKKSRVFCSMPFTFPSSKKNNTLLWL